MTTQVSYVPGLIMIFIFLAMMILMYIRKISALIALPIMALLYALVGIPQYGQFFTRLSEIMGPAAFYQLMTSLTIFFFLMAVAFILASRKQLSVKTASWFTVAILLLVLLVNIKGVYKIFFTGNLGSLVGLLGIREIVNKILHDGALMLHPAYTVAIFGGMLAIMVKEKGIAQTFIKYAAELAGDNPILVAVIMMLVSFVLFTTLGGLGAIIMVGTIILPIMMSLGIPSLVAAGVFLIGLCAGGTFNPGNWALYEESLRVSRDDIQFFALIVIVLYLATGALFIVVNLMRGRSRYFGLMQPEALGEKKRRVPPIALLTPIVPIILVFRMNNFVRLFEYIEGNFVWLDSFINYFRVAANFWDNNLGAWDFIPAFIAGLVFCLVTTWEKDNIKILTKSVIEGAESVMPAVLLMFGIGMLLQAVRHPDVKAYLTPLITQVVPSRAFLYILIFGIGTPLALYRGPLNIWGLGLGIAGLILETGKLSAPLIMGAFMAVGAMQGVCDPTNTHNVWIASFINEDVIKITRKLLLYIWALAFLGLVLAAVIFHKGFLAH